MQEIFGMLQEKDFGLQLGTLKQILANYYSENRRNSQSQCYKKYNLEFVCSIRL